MNWRFRPDRGVKLGARHSDPQINLKCGEDRSDNDVAVVLRASNSTAGLRRKRHLERGTDGFFDEPMA